MSGAGIIFSQVLDVATETFMELSTLWNPYLSPLWHQSYNRLVAFAVFPREEEREDGMVRKEQDTLKEEVEGK